jgi:dTDP-4-dehydrorhamnose reductase
MRIAVTGKNGQTVRALLEIVEPDIEIIPVGKPELDLAKPKTIEPALQAAWPDLIVHAAAYTAVDRAEEEPELARTVNSEGTYYVAEAAARLKRPLIYLSSDYVFDGSKKSGAYREEDPVAPKNVYGTSKLAGERAVVAFSEDYVILRTSWLYAPYGKNFVRTMLAFALAGKEMRVVDDQFGCPTYAPDLARAIIGIARHLLASPADRELRGLFHFSGSGRTTSWAYLAQKILVYLVSQGLPVPTLIPISSAEYPTLATRPVNSRLDCGKLARVHGIRAPAWPDSLVIALEHLTKKKITE